MSALPPKADMFSARGHVCYGPKADIAWPRTQPISHSSSAIDDLLGGVVDHNRRIEVLKLRASAKHRFYTVLEGRSVSLFRSFDVLPQVHATAAPRTVVKQKSLMDQIWIGLPRRDSRPELVQNFFAAHTVGHFPQHDFRNHDRRSRDTALDLDTRLSFVFLSIIRSPRRRG